MRCKKSLTTAAGGTEIERIIETEIKYDPEGATIACEYRDINASNTIVYYHLFLLSWFD